MIVTSIKGAITPDIIGDYFVKYGYRSADNGTYYSAFRWTADTFNIGYEETYNLDRAIELLRNKNYVVCSVGNGLFTTGGHFIVLVGINESTIRVFDPYLYASKFETSTRRGKVTVDGNSVYVSIDNFRAYANALKFFAYSHDGQVQENKQTVTTSTYSRYVNANGGLNVRNGPAGDRIGGLVNNTRVTIDSTSGDWSHIISPVIGWVSSNYLSSTQVTVQVNAQISTKVERYRIGNYRVNASVLNVRRTASTKYAPKTWRQLSENARSQNRRLGKPYCNGYLKGVICTVTKVSGNWGFTKSGWICLDYCKKL